MCTLILGRDVVAPNTLLLGANRDEDPLRPSDPPGVLHPQPRVVGGRDRVAGGTWLAIREARAAVAILNRRDPGSGTYATPPDRRSRGLLALDVARATANIDAHALAAAAANSYAPFSLVFASHDSCWVLTNDGTTKPRVREVPRGWHVITHLDLDDAREPRTVALRERLENFRPESVEAAESRVAALLRSHGEPAGSHAHALPPVCLHGGRIETVSSALVWLARGSARYLHAEGRPCEDPFRDLSHLLAESASAPETP